jgi:hypothetical protein
MPTYTFKNNDTDEVFDRFISISAKDIFLSENPHIKQIIGAPKIISGRGDMKVSDGFKEVLSKVAENNPYTPLAEKLGGRDAKTIKNTEIINKSRKKSGLI